MLICSYKPSLRIHTVGLEKITHHSYKSLSPSSVGQVVSTLHDTQKLGD